VRKKGKKLIYQENHNEDLFPNEDLGIEKNLIVDQGMNLLTPRYVYAVEGNSV
jgi:hypothetical protein